MDRDFFINKQLAFDSFTQLRSALNDVIEKPREFKKSFADCFAEVGTLALEGNPIAQDMMSYYYKDGVKDQILQNYDLYMQWEILAGANGNEFAIEKLQFFLGYAFDEIAANERFEEIFNKQNLDENNYVYVLGNLLCEGIVDEMQITAQKLVETPPAEVRYTAERLRKYRRALDSALPKVIDYLLS